ncbi:MAG TPA: alpha/beta hydrolase [Longimicrobiaceae bacterium]|nr:alpha/beta hydrolase [Longimicrobiaceae bacterium]
MSADPEYGARLGAAAAAWADSRRVRVGEWEVRYFEAGEGPAVVLVHGLGVSADYWIRNGPPIAAAGFRLLAPDLPGFGRTEGPEGGLSIVEQAGALSAWADALALGPASYAGHSLSCQSVIELAVREPARVRALVLIGPTGDPSPGRLPKQAWRLFLDAWREPWKLLAMVGVAYLRAGPTRVWKTWTKGAEHDPLTRLPRVRVPGMVVVGTRDPVVERDFARRLTAGLPAGRLVWLEGASHAAQFDCAEEFNEEVIRFLRSLESAPPAARRSPTPAAEQGSRGGP